MMRRSQYALAAVGALGAVAAVLAACSGTPSSTLCGAGTRLVNGTCVAAAGGDGGLDAGLDVEVPPDQDGGSDAETDDAGPDDPCPTVGGNGITLFDGGAIYNCDPKCGPVASRCEESRCTPAGKLRAAPAAPYADYPPEKVTLRLPRDPWTLGGECDPDPALRYAVPQDIPYAVRAPQPRYQHQMMIVWRVDPKPTSVPTFIEPRGYTYRFMLDGTVRKDQNSGVLFAPGSTRLEPLAAASGFSPFERDRTTCERVDALEFETNLPSGVVPGQAPGGMLNYYRVVFFTDAQHIAARNLTIDMSPTAACEVKP
jgi:hypothetical protein